MAWAAGRLGVGLHLGARGRSLEGETLPVTGAERLSARLEELASTRERAVARGCHPHLLELSALATQKAVELDPTHLNAGRNRGYRAHGPGSAPPPEGLVPVEPAA
jgi:hypothetical protein